MEKDVTRHNRFLLVGLVIVLCAAVALFVAACACAREENVSSSRADTSLIAVSDVPARLASSSSSKSASSSSAASSSSSSSSKAAAVPEEEPGSEAGAAAAAEIAAVSKPFWTLILGLDTRQNTVEGGPDETRSYSDIMILTYVNPNTHRIGMLTLPRDTLVYYDGNPGKLNDAYHSGGIQATLDKVAELTGVRADYYVEGKFWTFVKFVDELGGLDINIPMAMHWEDIMTGIELYLEPGDAHLNGGETLVYARQRKQYDGNQDAIRQTQDRKIVAALLRQVMRNPDGVEGNVDTMLANLGTNLSRDQLISLAKDFSAHADTTTFVSGSGPYDGGLDESMNLWYIAPDEGLYRQLVATIEAGGDPNAILPAADVW